MDYVKIKQTGVLCGLYQKRVEPGYVLENGTALLESEKDEQGRYALTAVFTVSHPRSYAGTGKRFIAVWSRARLLCGN